jgi:hypothetical protein
MIQDTANEVGTYWLLRFLGCKHIKLTNETSYVKVNKTNEVQHMQRHVNLLAIVATKKEALAYIAALCTPRCKETEAIRKRMKRLAAITKAVSYM